MEAMLIGTIEPILNPVWVMLILGEVPSAWALAGGTLVLAAAVLRGVVTAQTVRTQSPTSSSPTSKPRG